ncbi:MAG: DUF4255 domain-containing protein [Deltaproteobacteria bacterium]
MALTYTDRAIGAVTQLLANELNASTGLNVSVGRPNSSDGPRVNLYLYEAAFDATLRNTALAPDQQAPVWLTLRYLMTAYEDTGNSNDSVSAHRNLGRAVRGLQSLNYLRPPGGLGLQDELALAANPEPLKITFVEASSELLARLMQGTDEHYRFSLAFEARPVMIATPDTSGFAPLVGISNVTPLPAGDDGRHISVSTAFANPIQLDSVTPNVFATGATLTLQGAGLPTSMRIRIGPIDHVMPGSSPTLRMILVDAAVLDPTEISAGPHPLTVYENLPNGRRRCSQIVPVLLRPTVNSVTVSGLARVGTTPEITATLQLDGELLGRAEDDVGVALWANGRVEASFDAVVDLVATSPSQATKQVTITTRDAVVGQPYQLMYRVNGALARSMPIVDLTPP